MKNFIIILSIFIIEMNTFMVSAQKILIIPSDSLSFQMKQIATAESQTNWIKFKENANIRAETMFSEYKSAFGLSDDDEMVNYKTDKDDLGFTQNHFQQYYKNIPIDGESVTVHTQKNGITYAANGNILTGINLDIIPVLSPPQAIDFALKKINSQEYRWQSEFWKNEIKERTAKPDASYFPIPELVIKEIKNGIYRQYFLAYRMDIYSSSPNYSQRIFIDANTGGVLQTFPLESN